MKRIKQLFCAISFICMFTGCSKVYEVEFENLLLAPISNVLNTPEYISGCRMEIKTSDKFNIDEYLERCRNIEKWGWEEDYSYTRYWGDNSGVFRVPSGKGKISIYSNGEKVLDLKYDNGINITYGMVWKDGDVVCEFKGTLKVDGECVLESYYFLQGKLIWYNNDSDLYMQKKLVTDGYAPNCKQYDLIAHYYYPTGVVSRKVVERYMGGDGELEYWSTVEDVYYNRDGSEMTMADRLFENHEEYVILPTGYNHRRDGDVYIILMPKVNVKTKGYGAIISSDSYNFSSFTTDRTFEYRIDGNEIICDEFFYHTRYSTGRVENQKRRTLEIDVDYYSNIIVRGEFSIYGWEVNCKMKPSQKGYSDWLYTTLQEKISKR